MERSGRDDKQMVKFANLWRNTKLASIDIRKVHLKVNISAFLSYNNKVKHKIKRKTNDYSHG